MRPTPSYRKPKTENPHNVKLACEPTKAFDIRRIYVCHPFSRSPEKNCQEIRAICKDLVSQGLLPVAPQLFLPQFVDESSQRELALKLCCALVELCHEVKGLRGSESNIRNVLGNGDGLSSWDSGEVRMLKVSKIFFRLNCLPANPGGKRR